MLGAIRRYFLAGILALAPVTITAWVLWKIFRYVDSWLRPLIEHYTGFPIPGLGFVSTILLVLLVGVFAQNIVGREMLGALGRVLRRVPLASSIYDAVKEIGDAFIGTKKSLIKRVVLFPWPSPGIWAMGFETGRVSSGLIPGSTREYSAVFYPTTPNPATGHIYFVPTDELIELDITVEEALRLAISGGAVIPGGLAPRGAPTGPAAGRPESTRAAGRPESTGAPR
ncbi:MAG: DUF502 domain-containing protein [bacterium]